MLIVYKVICLFSSARLKSAFELQWQQTGHFAIIRKAIRALVVSLICSDNGKLVKDFSHHVSQMFKLYYKRSYFHKPQKMKQYNVFRGLFEETP